ncbi:MAG: bifunctional phosphoribosylaminoimidazolecarboxamide formyltransferase/IMP cyclohydrolase [Gammaproteobacteria bacterium RIFCSPHIGHO2_12_FULL_45_9]|nr:MAG: bifunctional phosphoribosylaminoimidazolecarboxamide formyltransferase/IMP cyclohydrolase [Gammaproteobacteria bacterium RIFCSPHIGHO2_12_FULL_45_9]
MQNIIPIKTALLSVSDKTGIADFAHQLAELNIGIISTGKTSQLLQEQRITCRTVTEVTGFPEIMDGRVKTLHPKIHGGILGQRDKHMDVAKQHQIEWIDLVVVNLYPFAETIKKPNTTLAEAIEQIDVGGPTMIRAAAKNFAWVAIIIDPNDYALVLSEIREHQGLSLATRQRLAEKAFAHTADYDAVICGYLRGQVLPTLTLHLENHTVLRYGENPQQQASAYRIAGTTAGMLSATQRQGKPLSYNNLVDADAAWNCVQEFTEPACVIVKHANPCGAAQHEQITEAFMRAFNADSLSAFGGIVALNRPCTKAIAEFISQIFMEVIVAPSYEAEALTRLATKPNLRVLAMEAHLPSANEMKFIEGAVLIQNKDTTSLTQADLQCVTQAKPSEQAVAAMLFAWRVLKHMKSNAILIANQHATVGIGVGQVSRVDAVELAIHKMKVVDGEELILASDAFFPFRDSIDKIAPTGIHTIIQSGGSMRDEEVIAACNEYGLAMVFTGKRCFRH